jgi:hypothetical protein
MAQSILNAPGKQSLQIYYYLLTSMELEYEITIIGSASKHTLKTHKEI